MVADKAGFEKPIRWFLRSWWLSNVSSSDASRVVLWPEANEPADETIYIVDSWIAPPAGQTTRSLHVYTNAPFVRLWINGHQHAPPIAVPVWGEATFPAVPFVPGNLTASDSSAPFILFFSFLFFSKSSTMAGVLQH